MCIRDSSWTARANLAYSIPQGGDLNLNYQMSSIANERYDTYDLDFESSRDRMAQHIFGLSYGTTLLHGRLRGMIFAKDYLYHVAIEQADMYWLTGVKDVPTQQTKNKLGYGLAYATRLLTNWLSKLPSSVPPACRQLVS